ncbi:helix-turn-helix transcriptional regulator [Agrobacterium rosae]|uniref:ArsR/SmtB family transcription factor n=1 Tax=Agrobacterium rosae TaxID=1972867 RepID=UPI0019D38FBB|nr:metalloregulator ArsR/SmtB family transcription factor [Agrobacterium rosae]MBN7808356.1 helix-turn-helix transcriptional regulator [Agrobacterium rosae]
MYSNASKARLLTNLSNAARLELLSIVSEREMSVGELCSTLNMSQSAVSQHLARLRSDGLVNTRREAQTIYYSCANLGVQRVLKMLDEIFSPEFTAENAYVLKRKTPPSDGD